jgi:MYXO-CTERM domain-containing protein
MFFDRRTRARSFGAALFLAASGALAQGTAPDPGAWPMRARDPQRTAWAPGAGRLDATQSIRWSYYVGGNVDPLAAMTADLTGDGDDEIVAIVGGKLVARDLQDRVVWDSIPLGLTSIVGYRDLAGLGYPVIVAVRSGPPAGVYVIDSRNGALLWSREDFNDAMQAVPRGQGVNILNTRVADLNTDGSGTPAGRPAILLRVSGGEAIAHAFTFAGSYATAVDAWRFPVGTTPNTHWVFHVGYGDFDGDRRLDLAAQLNSTGTTRLYSGADDAMQRGAVLMNGTRVGAPALDGLTATAALRFDGAAHDVSFAVNRGDFGVIDAINPARSWGVAFVTRGPGGAPAGNVDVRNVSAPDTPYLPLMGTPGYLVVNVFDSHDCEVRSLPAATCSDLDGINDAVGVRRWHVALYNPTDGRFIAEIPDRVALATVDLTGDGQPEIITQSAGNTYDVPRVTSIAAYRVTYDPMPPGRTTLTSMWQAPNTGLAGVVSRALPTATPRANVPLIIPSAMGPQLLLYQGDPSSITVGMPTGLALVDAATGVTRASNTFRRGQQSRPVGVVRTAPGLSGPDGIVVSDSDGTFKIYNLRFGPPDSTLGNLGVVTSGGFIASIAAAQLAGTNPRRMDLVTTESDGALSVVPTDDATLTRPPVATARYFGRATQYPLVVRGEDRSLQVIVANHLGASPYLAAITALGPTEVWRSEPIALPPNGRFNLYPLGVADVNADGTADVVVSYDGLLSTGALTCCGSSFLNVVSGRSASGNHPLLWTAPFTPETAGQGACCWAVAGATGDVNGDGRDDVAIAMNAAVVVRTGDGAAAAGAQLLYAGDNATLTDPSSMTLRAISYGWPVLSPFDTSLGRSLLSGIGFFGGQGLALHDVTPMPTRTTGVASWTHPEFSEGTLVSTGAVASYAMPAAHGARDPVGFGFGASGGVFYALNPAGRTGATMPLRWARCLRNGRADVVSGTRPDDCAGGRALSDAAAADIDNDMRDEFVVGSADGYLYVLAAETGALEFAYNFQTAVGSPIVADVDGDGTLGLIVPTGDGYVTSLAASSADPVIRNPRVVGVTEMGGRATVTMPDVAVSTSESVRYIAAAWDDPSTLRNSEYRARVLTTNGSPVVAWAPVTRMPGTPTVTFIAAGSFTVGLRYVVEISAQAPGSPRTDIVATAPVLVTDATPPRVTDLRVTPTLMPQEVAVTATASDNTELRGYTLTVRDPSGTEVHRATAALSGLSAPIMATWSATGVTPLPGLWSVTVEARDIGGRTGSAEAPFAWPVADAGSDAGADAADVGEDVAADVAADAADDAVADVADAAAEGGVVADAPAPPDVTPPADAAVATDLAPEAGAAPPGDSGGCGCRATNSDARGLHALAAIAALALLRRRRAATRR